MAPRSVVGLRLPAGTQIDARDPNAWQLPVGVMLFKEFAVSGRRVETRLIARVGPGKFDYWMGAFVWHANESDARFQLDGLSSEADHEIPNQKQCGTCHNGAQGRILGLSAIQLGRDCQGPTCLAELVALGALSPTPDELQPGPPGTPEIAMALGYLHANCGNCHNRLGTAWRDTDLDLSLQIGALSPADTNIYQSCIGVGLTNFVDDGLDIRVAPGYTQQSAVWRRMQSRSSELQMPPFGSRHPDLDGLDLVGRWIESLGLGHK